MRPYFWRIVICVAPVLESIGIVVWAYFNDAFKLGVDLSGGTILVYEIDLQKKEDDKSGGFDAKRDTNMLADQLKKRIDPNDLYNVTIRPAGADGRVEIILPTGGVARAQRAQEQWDELVREMEKEYELKPGTLKVKRGHTQELAARIQQLVSQEKWQTKLFNDSKSLQELATKIAADYLPLSDKLQYYANFVAAAAAVGHPDPLGNVLVDAAAYKPIATMETKHIPFHPTVKTFPELVELVKTVVVVPNKAKQREIEYVFKQQAWNKLIQMMLEKWPQLKEPESRKKAFENIEPDSFEELIGRAEVKGNTVGQAFLTTLEPVMGNRILVSQGGEDAKADFLSRDKILEFIKEYYGPSVQSVEEKIDKSNKSSGRQKDLSVEQIQRVKDSVSNVGKLEFKILANQHDDKAAIEDAKEFFKQAGNIKTELDRLQKLGLPPYGPRVGITTGKPKEYIIKLARGESSTVTYSWVELGPQERQQLHLNNAAKNEPGHGSNWTDMEVARKAGIPIQLKLPGTGGERYWLNGALFFSRECQIANEDERRKKQVEYFVLARNAEKDEHGEKAITGDYLSRAANEQGSDGRPTVAFEFNPVGARLFGELTGKNVPSSGTGEDASNKRHLAIILDGLVMSAPTINSQITSRGQISGSFTGKEVDTLVNILRAGQLSYTLKRDPVSENTMGSTLGQETILAGLTAIVIAFGAILAFMLVYYRFAGLVACVALLANLLITVAFMTFFGATWTLPGLAGLVLTLGMAVDANVLIYERLREERERGANLLVAIRQGYDRALPTIIDTHLSSIFTAIVLYIVGNDQLKGFGISLTLGLLISLFTSLYMTRLMFDLWQARGWLKKLSMLRLFGHTDIDFMGIRYYWFTATVLLTIFGMVVFIGRLPNDLNIDFVGGTAYGGQLTRGKELDTDGYRKLLDEDRQKKLLKPEVTEVASSDGHLFTIVYQNPDGTKTEPRTVNLANKPKFDDVKDREADVQKRASALPDWSVVLIFSTSHPSPDPNKSVLFNVRTSEKEAELVQATLDRLLQDEKGESLLHKVKMDYKVTTKKDSPNLEATLTFVEAKDPSKKVFASPSFVLTLLNRELTHEFKVKDASGLKFAIELEGDDSDVEDRFAEAKVTFTSHDTTPLDQATQAKIVKALGETVREFRDRPQPESLMTFDSQLAEETRMRAMWAVLGSWGAILLYLWFRFGNWTFGAAAVICLIHDLFFTLGIIACCHYIHNLWPGFLGIEDFKIDLTAVAALLTLVGYSVNDTIVVFDRIREVRGKNPDLTPQMINDSVNQTLSRTILSSLSVWLVVFVLYVWGGPGLHLFAFVMVVGVIVGTYSSIYIASPLLLLFGEGSRAVAKGREQPKAETGPDVRIQPAQ